MVLKIVNLPMFEKEIYLQQLNNFTFGDHRVMSSPLMHSPARTNISNVGTASGVSILDRDGVRSARLAPYLLIAPTISLFSVCEGMQRQPPANRVVKVSSIQAVKVS
jgi:hypothetical protein